MITKTGKNRASVEGPITKSPSANFPINKNFSFVYSGTNASYGSQLFTQLKAREYHFFVLMADGTYVDARVGKVHLEFVTLKGDGKDAGTEWDVPYNRILAVHVP